MSQTKKFVLVGAARVLAIAAAAPASAHNNGFSGGPNHYADSNHTYPDGGSWYYGIHEMINGSERNVDSAYYHGSSYHRASVQGQYYDNSGWVSSGQWAYATASARWMNNYSYYDV